MAKVDLTSWLNLQCRMMPDVKRAIVVGGLDSAVSAPFEEEPVALWPGDDIETADLLSAAKLVANRKSPLISAAPGTSGDASKHSMMLAYPLLVGEPHEGVIVLELNAADEQRPILMQLLKWGEAWLRLLVHEPLQDSTAQGQDGRISAIIEAACTFDELKPSVAMVATRLAHLFHCEQVAVGMLEKGSMVLQGISHSANFDARTGIARGLEELLQECVEFETVIETPDGQENNYPAHQHFSDLNEIKLYTLPLCCDDKVVGALLLQFKAHTLSAGEKHELDGIGSFLGALFEARRRAERPIRGWLKEVIPIWYERYLGAGYSRYLVLAGLVLVTLLALGSGNYRVSAPANLEGRVQRAVVAPIDGFVLEAHARAGEMVKQGQVIAELDDRELKLDIARLENQRNKLDKQYRRELADLNHSQSRIMQSQVAQVDAELELVRGQLQRTQLTVPFDGVIIEGDLSRSLGAPVEKGEVLFEIAPLNEYRLVLQVNERDVAYLETGQTGELHLNAHPGDPIPFEVQLVATVHTLDTGEVAYRTEARLKPADHVLRPGMQGVGKIEVGKRSYLWILFHRISDWFRLTLWSLLP